jgi:hypothetical protein
MKFFAELCTVTYFSTLSKSSCLIYILAKRDHINTESYSANCTCCLSSLGARQHFLAIVASSIRFTIELVCLIYAYIYTGCIKKRRPLEIKHIVKIWMPFQLHICWIVVREILRGAYIRKRRPLEFEITFKQKFVCSCRTICHAYCT